MIPQFVHLSLFPVPLSQLSEGAHFQIVGDKSKVYRIDSTCVHEIGCMEGKKYLPHPEPVVQNVSETSRVYVLTKTTPKKRDVYVQGG